MCSLCQIWCVHVLFSCSAFPTALLRKIWHCLYLITCSRQSWNTPIQFLKCCDMKWQRKSYGSSIEILFIQTDIVQLIAASPWGCICLVLFVYWQGQMTVGESLWTLTNTMTTLDSKGTYQGKYSHFLLMDILSLNFNFLACIIEIGMGL